KVAKQKVSLNEASNNAVKFLKDNGFKDLDLFESAQYDNLGVFTFVSNQDGVRIYPDSIRVKVALDNGRMTAFAAEDYLKSHHQREIPDAGITKEEARSKVNPQLKVMEDRQAIIINDL